MIENALVDTLSATVKALGTVGAPYAVTGSVASTLHGEICVSADVDLAVRLSLEQARQLAQVLPSRFYRSENMLVEAARRCTMANLVDMTTGLKVDLCVLPSQPFYDRVMQRSRPLSYGADAPEFVTVTAEDIILMKLLWRKESRSQKQWDNALGVVRVQGHRLDWKYLQDQAVALEIQNDLVALRNEAHV